MNKVIRGLMLGGLLALCDLSWGCSVVMEATRPAPVRLAQFKPGDSRDSVVDKLGQPVTTASDGDSAKNCDLYALPLSGYGDAGKASIAFGEFAADVFTLGIAEAISTPAEALTRNKKTPIWFCYKNGALARITPKLEGEDLASSKSIAAPPSARGAAAPAAPPQAPAASLPPTSVIPVTE